MRNEILTEIYRLQSLMGVKKSILTEGTITDFFKTSLVKNLIKKGSDVLDNSAFGKYINIKNFESAELANLRTKYANKLVDDIISDTNKFDEFLNDVSKGLDEQQIIRDFIDSDAAKSIKTELTALTTRFKSTAEKMSSDQMRTYKDEILNLYKNSLEKDPILGSNDNFSIRETLLKDLETKLDDNIVKIKAEKDLKNIERSILQTAKAKGRNKNLVTLINSNFKLLAKYWYYVVKAKFGNKILYETSMMADLTKINEAFDTGKASIPILEDLLSKFFAKYYEGNLFKVELRSTLEELFNKMKKSNIDAFKNVDNELINKIITRLEESPKLKSIFEQESIVKEEISRIDLLKEKIIPWTDLFNPIYRPEQGLFPIAGAWYRFIINKSVISSEKQLKLLGSMTVSDRIINFFSKQLLNWVIFPMIIGTARTVINNIQYVEELGLNKIKRELETYKKVMEIIGKLKNNPNIDPELKATIEEEIRKKNDEFKLKEQEFKKDLKEKIKNNYIEALPITGKPYGSDSIIAYLIKIPMCMTYIDEVAVLFTKYIWSLIVGNEEESKRLAELINTEAVFENNTKCKTIFEEKITQEQYKEAINELYECLSKQQTTSEPKTTENKFTDEDTEGTIEGLKKYLKSINKEYKENSFDLEQKYGESTEGILYLWDKTNKWHPQQN